MYACARWGVEKETNESGGCSIHFASCKTHASAVHTPAAQLTSLPNMVRRMPGCRQSTKAPRRHSVETCGCIDPFVWVNINGYTLALALPLPPSVCVSACVLFTYQRKEQYKSCTYVPISIDTILQAPLT